MSFWTAVGASVLGCSFAMAFLGLLAAAIERFVKAKS